MAEILRMPAVLPLVGLAKSPDDGVMINVHCPQHGRAVLLSLRHILGIENDDDGTTVHWVCWCGHRGSDQFSHDGESTPRAKSLVAA